MKSGEGQRICDQLFNQTNELFDDLGNGTNINDLKNI